MKKIKKNYKKIGKVNLNLTIGKIEKYYLRKQMRDIEQKRIMGVSL
jgi:hypothetical protein